LSTDKYLADYLEAKVQAALARKAAEEAQAWSEEAQALAKEAAEYAQKVARKRLLFQ